MIPVKQYQLGEKSSFLLVRFGRVGNDRKLKLDKEGASSNGSLHVQTTADVKRLSAQKKLLVSPELAAIATADAQMRVWLDFMCLPYNLGVRIVPAKHLDEVYNKLTEYEKVTRPELVQALANAYPSQVEKAKEELGPHFNPSDYKTVDQLLEEFTFDWQFVGFGVPDGLADKYDEEAAKLEAKFKLAGDEITFVMREAFLKLTSHLKDVLTPNEEGKPKRLFKTAVTNIQDYIKYFDPKNVNNDIELDQLVKKTGELLGGVSVDDIKSSDDFKAKVLSEMDSITGELSKLVEDVPGRKLKF